MLAFLPMPIILSAVAEDDHNALVPAMPLETAGLFDVGAALTRGKP
jgi:hypothetical protein